MGYQRTNSSCAVHSCPASSISFRTTVRQSEPGWSLQRMEMLVPGHPGGHSEGGKATQDSSRVKETLWYMHFGTAASSVYCHEKTQVNPYSSFKQPTAHYKMGISVSFHWKNLVSLFRALKKWYLLMHCVSDADHLHFPALSLPNTKYLSCPLQKAMEQFDIAPQPLSKFGHRNLPRHQREFQSCCAQGCCLLHNLLLRTDGWC